MKLLYPYQYIKILSPKIYRIGISSILQKKLKDDFKKNSHFKLEIKNIETPIFRENIACSLYNMDSSYLFFSPYTGIIVNKNMDLIKNTKLILDNNENQNWLFDLKIYINYEYNTYS